MNARPKTLEPLKILSDYEKYNKELEILDKTNDDERRALFETSIERRYAHLHTEHSSQVIFNATYNLPLESKLCNIDDYCLEEQNRLWNKELLGEPVVNLYSDPSHSDRPLSLDKSPSDGNSVASALSNIRL